jgi:hypothetical protein
VFAFMLPLLFFISTTFGIWQLVTQFLCALLLLTVACWRGTHVNWH